MLALLREPIPVARLIRLSLAITAAVAVYCLGYSALAGKPETLQQSLGWALVNVFPWLPVLEAAKRARTSAAAVATLLAGLAASLALGALVLGATALPFETWRRIPALIALAALIVALRWRSQRGSAANCEALPLLPRQIDWIRAAGNYVELRAGGHTIIHRSALSAVEHQLAGHGFIRIHRSLLVRRDRIARIRAQDVVMFDGTHLKIGKRYRADLAA